MDFIADFIATVGRADATPEALALQIAGLAYPELDPQQPLAELDALAAHMALRLADVPPGAPLADAFMQTFRDDWGFAGNVDDYYDPDNSFLNAVLARRTGLPILLSLICVALGRRLGLTIDGAGFPGHFMARYRHAREQWLLDPFHGRVLAAGEVQEYLSSLFGQPVSVSQQAFTPVTPPAFAQRILNNLRNVYLSREEWARAVQVLDYMLTLLPSSTALLQERALLNYRLDDLERAAADLQRYFTLTGGLWSALGLEEDAGAGASDAPADAQLVQLFQQIQATRRRLN